MTHILSLISLLLFLSACDLKQPPEDIDLDTIYDTLPSYSDTDTYPYIDSFKYVLESSHYESPDGSQFVVNENFRSDSFYLDRDQNLLFALYKEPNSQKTASQLIQKQTWHTSEDNGNYLISIARCYKPKEVDSYTWIQVHGVGKNDANRSVYYDYPLVSLTWERNMKDVYDHIWAVITKSSPGVDEPKIYEWVDLGARPDNFFAAEIHIVHNIMEIKINHSTLSIQNISYWEDVPSYFKAGISLGSYIDGGEAGVSFSELRYENNASNVENITHF